MIEILAIVLKIIQFNSILTFLLFRHFMMAMNILYVSREYMEIYMKPRG